MKSTRLRRCLAVLAAGALTAAGVAASSGTAHAQAACDVEFTANQWGDGAGGFTASVTITNLGEPLSGWTLAFDLPGGAQLIQGWSADWDQEGPTVTAGNLAWNGNLGTGGQTSIGFNGTGYGGDPEEFFLNGASCSDEPEPTDPELVASTGTLVLEAGESGDFTLVLSDQPEADVDVAVAVTGDPGVAAAPAALTFTTADWDQPQQVTVTVDADAAAGASAQVTADADGVEPAVVNVMVTGGDPDDEYLQRFLELYELIKDPASGYFSPHGVPYHSVETLIVEAPDHGHETTSEAFSYWLWLEANYGRVTGDWQPFNDAWATMEQYIIPGSDDQPSAGAAGDAQYAAEHEWPDMYPSQLNPDVPVGQDPLRDELSSTYGTGDIYGMHWLLDVDNTYGYGHCGDGTTSPAYINTFQRGPQESVWETVPHPSCETKDFGGEHGYLDLFIAEDADPATQWRYTNAPDADARAVQAAYWALVWATEQGNQGQIADTLDKAAMMGDYLRYALFDKYFKQVGDCVGAEACPGASGKDSAHYLLSWYYAWGGSYPGNEWSWRIGSSHNHFGYQNPVAAWAMVNVPELAPDSPTADTDWSNSLQRQIEFYRWLQSAEGGIAGGVTNSWLGHYGEPPDGTATFYGMFYDEKPVYHDPPSNEWFGFQAWSMQRVAEYYWLTGDDQVADLLDDWVQWASGEVTVDGADFAIPATMAWEGQPESYDGEPGGPGPNPDLHVTVTDHGQDVGVAAALARTLLWYAAATGDDDARQLAKDLIDALHEHNDGVGIATVEEREDYERFDDVYDAGTRQGLFIPDGWSGTMPNGDQIEPGASFLDIRSFYLDDPAWPQVQEYLDGGDPPEFTYHRFWAQADIANAFADYAFLFPQQ